MGISCSQQFVWTRSFSFHYRYRILAFDHDLLSFADLNFEEWPVVLITNPKSFLYSSSTHEPLVKILYSTHIRYSVMSQFHNILLYLYVYTQNCFLNMCPLFSEFTFLWKIVPESSLCIVSVIKRLYSSNSCLFHLCSYFP